MKESFTYSLVKLYGFNAPLLVDDLAEVNPDITRQAIYKKLGDAIDLGEVVRYDRGIYYVPLTSGKRLVEECVLRGIAPDEEAASKVMGLAEVKTTEPSPFEIARRRWIEDHNGNVFGYLSGASMEYEFGLTSEEPAEFEVSTNKESSRIRDLGPFGKWDNVIVRRARSEVSRSSVDALRFLDMITKTHPEEMGEQEMRLLTKFAMLAGRERVYDHVENYPGKTAKRLLACERKGLFG